MDKFDLIEHNKIPTAEEFMKFQINGKVNWENWKKQIPPIIYTSMIEFAKLHVNAALKATHRNFQIPEEDLEFTMESYPLTNIK